MLTLSLYRDEMHAHSYRIPGFWLSSCPNVRPDTEVNERIVMCWDIEGTILEKSTDPAAGLDAWSAYRVQVVGEQ